MGPALLLEITGRMAGLRRDAVGHGGRSGLCGLDEVVESGLWRGGGAVSRAVGEASRVEFLLHVGNLEAFEEREDAVGLLEVVVH